MAHSLTGAALVSLALYAKLQKGIIYKRHSFKSIRGVTDAKSLQSAITFSLANLDHRFKTPAPLSAKKNESNCSNCHFLGPQVATPADLHLQV